MLKKRVLNHRTPPRDTHTIHFLTPTIPSALPEAVDTQSASAGRPAAKRRGSLATPDYPLRRNPR